MEGLRKWECLCKRGHRLKKLVLFNIFFFFPLLTLYAQTLQIISPIEPKLFKGSPEEINSFIEVYEKQIKEFISQVHKIPLANLTDEDKKEINDTLSLLEGLPFQLSRLKREIKAAPVKPISLPEIGNPPFRLDIFDTYISLYQTISQTIKEASKKLKILNSDLSEIEKNLKQMFTYYVELKEEKTKRIKYYVVVAQLLSLQVEYALKSLDRIKTENALNKLSLLLERCRNRLSYIFKRLKIGPKDLKKVEIEKNKADKKEEAIKSKYISAQQSINKDITILELRLDSITNRLFSAQISEVGKRLLQIEKEKIEACLNRLQYKKELLKQKWLISKTETELLNFKYEWIKDYFEKAGYKKAVSFIKRWKKKLDRLKGEAVRLKEKLEQRRFELSFVNEKIIRIEREAEIEKDPDVKESLQELKKELWQNRNYLNKLVNILAKNSAYISSAIWKIDKVLLLIRNRASTFEKIVYETKINIQSIWIHVKGILYYPLWSVGGNIITIITILKIILFLCLGIYLLRLLRKKLSKFLIEKAGLSVGVVNSISSLSYYFMIILLLFVALSTAGINLNQITIILGALGVGIGFGLQTIANNFISGLILLTERTIKVGDIVELENGLMGRVKDVSIRSTVIRTYDGLDIIVPNSDFIANKVATWTYGDDWRRLRIPFGVSYGTDPDKVAEIAKEVARQIPTTVEDKEHPVSVWFEGFGESSLNFSLLVWCRMEKLKPVTGLMSDYYFALFKRFKEEGIEIPFPQRDLHIKSFSQALINTLKKGGENDSRL